MQINYPWGLSEDGLLQMLVQRRTSLCSTLWKSWKKLLQLIRSSFYYADRNVSWRVQTFGKETASAKHMYYDKFVKFYNLQNIRGNPWEDISLSLHPFLFCGRRLYRICKEASPHPQIFSNWRQFQCSGEPVQSWTFYCQNHHLWGGQVPVDGGGFLQAWYLLKNIIGCCNIATSTLDTWSNSDMCCGTCHV